MVKSTESASLRTDAELSRALTSVSDVQGGVQVAVPLLSPPVVQEEDQCDKEDFHLLRDWPEVPRQQGFKSSVFR